MFEDEPVGSESDVALLIKQAKLDARSGNLRLALTRLEEAAEIARDDGLLHSDIGLTYFKLGCLDQAIDCFERALEISPDDERIAADYSCVLRNCGDLAQAEQVLRNVIALGPRTGSSFLNLGALLEVQSRSSEAIAVYREAVSLYGPGARVLRGRALKRLAHLMKEEGDSAQALEYAVLGLEATPTDEELSRTACELALSTGQTALFERVSRCLARRGSPEDKRWVQRQLESIRAQDP